VVSGISNGSSSDSHSSSPYGDNAYGAGRQSSRTCPRGR
jgi:hypothetical protein